jgi:hypothetical protein
VRDIILPGEMKDLMNKVTEEKKAAEANLIVRREETAAMRSQANTAKVLADNPTLMRLRLGEKGLADRVVNCCNVKLHYECKANAGGWDVTFHLRRYLLHPQQVGRLGEC